MINMREFKPFSSEYILKKYYYSTYGNETLVNDGVLVLSTKDNEYIHIESFAKVVNDFDLGFTMFFSHIKQKNTEIVNTISNDTPVSDDYGIITSANDFSMTNCILMPNSNLYIYGRTRYPDSNLIKILITGKIYTGSKNNKFF